MRTSIVSFLCLALLAGAATAMDAVPAMPNPDEGSSLEAARRDLQAFADELTVELGKLDTLMTTACPGYINHATLRPYWNAITWPLQSRWTAEEDKARVAYWRKETSKRLPAHFMGWTAKGKAAWNWLTNSGVEFYLKRKFFEMQASCNKRTNVPNCAIVLAWCTQQAQNIDKAVGGSKNIYVKGLLARKIRELEQLVPRVEMVQRAHREWSRGTADFLKKNDPEKHLGYKKLLETWMPEEGSAFVTTKENWTRQIDKAFRSYQISHEALVAVADPIIQGDFLMETNHIKYWKAKNLAGELRSLIADLKRRLKTLR